MPRKIHDAERTEEQKARNRKDYFIPHSMFIRGLIGMAGREIVGAGPERDSTGAEVPGLIPSITCLGVRGTWPERLTKEQRAGFPLWFPKFLILMLSSYLDNLERAKSRDYEMYQIKNPEENTATVRESDLATARGVPLPPGEFDRGAAVIAELLKLGRFRFTEFVRSTPRVIDDFRFVSTYRAEPGRIRLRLTTEAKNNVMKKKAMRVPGEITQCAEEPNAAAVGYSLYYAHNAVLSFRKNRTEYDVPPLLDALGLLPDTGEAPDVMFRHWRSIYCNPLNAALDELETRGVIDTWVYWKFSDKAGERWQFVTKWNKFPTLQNYLMHKIFYMPARDYERRVPDVRPVRMLAV